MSALFVVAGAVAEALEAGRPVVALETTLVTHGLPSPYGVETALALEQEVRAAGAWPATIGVLDGTIRIGISGPELERLASAPAVAKLNPGNLAAGLASGAPGSTTVATTMFAARAAGIAVLATGGIGGVHRGDSGDVSADLIALSRIPVAVVCAGAKAILDLPRTVEALETLGVPVFGIGTDEFPAFYRRSSGLPVDARFDSVERLAAAVSTHWRLASGTGIVIANPIPAQDEVPADVYEGAMETALAEAATRQLRGRAVTPFLLDRVRALTGGESVRANVALLRHNARVAAQLSVELSALATTE
jgi:pseudouridylate synthase